MSKIKIGIVGYGNLGKGVEEVIKENQDMELYAIFTRRKLHEISQKDTNVKVESISNIEKYIGKIDVMILCGGSATDLPVQGPDICKHYNTVDSYDNHTKIYEYYKKMNKGAEPSGNISIIGGGWDPGLFSIIRAMSESYLPNGKDYTFWGRGVSQGHSDAIRRVKGVKNAIQYTIPIDEALYRVRRGEDPVLKTRDKHIRECFVVVEEGEDRIRIENEIKTMPHYFENYETIVNFIDEDELKEKHSAMFHGGYVFRSAVTGGENKHIIELALRTQSNPEFTASILLSYARAAYRMNKEGQKGAKTVYDVPVSYLYELDREILIKELL